MQTLLLNPIKQLEMFIQNAVGSFYKTKEKSSHYFLWSCNPS